MADNIHTKQAVSEMLQAQGVTPTQQRIAIAGLLFQRPQHLSADQILEAVNRIDATRKVSKATVYNTLNLFARKGLVREVIVDPSRVFYDSNTTEHHHVFNVDTGELTDIAPDQCRLEGEPGIPEGTVPVGVDVIIRVRSAHA